MFSNQLQLRFSSTKFHYSFQPQFQFQFQFQLKKIKMSRVERTLQRLEQRISEGSYYEAHQQIRTLANRQRKAKNFENATDIIYHGAQKLLEAKQNGSGCDLINYLLDVYIEEHSEIDRESRSRISALVSLLPDSEPDVKDIARKAISWSKQDSQLCHLFGTKLTKAGGSNFYIGERYLLEGTGESATVLATQLFEWSTQDPDPTTAPFYLSRAIFGYLLLQNIQSAYKSLSVFLKLLQQHNPDFFKDSVEITNSDIIITTSLPLLNYLQLLIPTCQRKAPDMFNRLNNRYESSWKLNPKLSNSFQQILVHIGAIYFGFQIKREANMLQDLMGSLFAAPPTTTS